MDCSAQSFWACVGSALCSLCSVHTVEPRSTKQKGFRLSSSDPQYSRQEHLKMALRSTSGWLLLQRAAPSPLLHQLVFSQAFSQLSCQKCRLPPRMKYILLVLLFHTAHDGARQVLVPWDHPLPLCFGCWVHCAALWSWSWLLWSALTGLQVCFSERWKVKF